MAELEQVVQRAEHLLAKAQSHKDQDYLDGVALNLHGFYAGVEHIFEEVAIEIDGALPTGPEWPRNLLRQMSAEVTNTRPAVIGHNVRECLDEFLGFRHVVRNVYTFNLRPSRLEELVEALQPCYTAFVQDVTAFCNFLDRLTSAE